MKILLADLKLLLPLTLAVTVFANAMRVEREDFLFFFRHQRLLLISLLSIFVLAPVVAIAVVEWLQVKLVIKVAIVTMSFSIIPPLLPWKNLETAGDRRYGIGLTLIVAALALVIVPLQVDLLGRVSGNPYGVPAWEISRYVFLVVLIPASLGALIGLRLPGLARKAAIPIAHFAGLAMLVVSTIILVVALKDVPHVLSFRAVLAMVLFNVVTLGIGHLLGGPRPERAVVLALSSASRHPALAVSIAAVNFPGEKFTAAIMLGVVVNMIVTIPYLRWEAKQEQAEAAPVGGGPDPDGS